MTACPTLTQFRVEPSAHGIVHLVFDCPGRTMNVFSDTAIDDLGVFANWLCTADVAGVVIRSGKTNAFCAGADLTELGVAYDMIMASAERNRFTVAFDHFFRLSSALRLLETSGKPVVAVIAGLALGGGCELALAAHHRILVDNPKVAMGLPESLVGLLPGAGGTQRLPRLIGVNASLSILLEGERLSGTRALTAGLVDTLVTHGEEIEAAEAWLSGASSRQQPWDRRDWIAEDAGAVAAVIAPIRERVLADTRGHYPAPLAILDCVEQGLPQMFDGAIRTEMSIFAHLIQREEARNMIQTMFLGKTEYERLKRSDAVPTAIEDAILRVRSLVADLSDDDARALSDAGFGTTPGVPVRRRSRAGYWIDEAEGRSAGIVLDAISQATAAYGAILPPEQHRVLDYAIVQGTGYPPYLGGPMSLANRRALGRS